MDQSEKSTREGRVYRHQRKNPSFSSSLLDEIYRSIDEGNNREDEEMVFYNRETMKTKQSSCTTDHVNQRKEEDAAEMAHSVRIRDCLSEKVVVRKPQSVSNLHSNRSSMVFNSSSSSSDSCCGGGFSSSETESVHGTRSTTTSSSSSSTFSSRPKPVRTNFSVEEKKNSSVSSSQQEKSNHFNGFIKTKSRALKMYGDLKKVKQPISPGGRLATFINSLFNAGTPKKTKISTTTTTTTTTTSVQDSNFDRKSTQASTCSSVSSFSRSCLSKTPTSSRTKRSVRFYPVSVIVDEDCRPCGHKCLYEDDEPGLMAATKVRKIEESIVPMIINEELKFHIMEKNRRVEEAARNLLIRNGYQKNKSNFDIRDLINYEDEDEDDDDAASCSSSDLFELDNLERYREELPVYETTHLGRNRAIANGF